MVCVPCFVIPVLLFVWHRFIQPLMLRYWNPWAVKDANGQVIENKTPEFPFQCAGGVCPFPGAKKALETSDAEITGQANKTSGEEAHRSEAEAKKTD